MNIDPHVHCRDGRESYKETIAHTLALCDAQGVDILFDMPNTDPPIVGAADVERRLRLIPWEATGRYRLYVGLTADPQQIAAAAALALQHRSVVGLKLYAGPSIGALAVTQEAEQQRVYEALAAAGYEGVLAVHCEKAARFTRAFDPKAPHTHSLARPVEAETASLADQIRWARAAGFKGTLHVCHVSAAASLTLIQEARRDLKVSCGVTPHHLLWSASQARGQDGLLYKVNPPLREPADTFALRKALKEGVIDWIESDHAPHPISEKLFPPYHSGYPSLCLYRALVEEYLPYWGFNKETIKRVTHDNILRVFGERKLRHDPG